MTVVPASGLIYPSNSTWGTMETASAALCLLVEE